MKISSILTSKTEIEAGGRVLQILHDALPAFGLPLPDDIVVGPGGASNTLLRLTPRRPFKTAWDLGCGSGVQAVALATHCEHVIATDIDQKALAYTQNSAATNGLQVETRCGSLFDPVAADKFDLVVSNPPFVIGQATELVHRESPLPADGLAQEFLTKIPNHLQPGGIAVVLLSWLETSDEDYESRILNWLPADCDAWVGMRDSQTPAAYVETWLRDAGRQADQVTRELWLQRLADWNTTAIAFGWVVLQKRTDVGGFHLVEDVREAAAIPTGEEVLERLQHMRAGDELNAIQILTEHFQPINRQTWRGPITLPGILSELQNRITSDTKIPEIVTQMATDFQVDEDDLLVLVLAAIKELVGLGKLELVTD